MKKYTLLLITSLFISSCYSYKVYDPETGVDELQSSNNPSSNVDTSIRGARQYKASADENTDMQNVPSKIMSSRSSKDGVSTSDIPKEKLEHLANKNKGEVSVKSIIKDKGYYQVDVFDKTYKMEAVKWQGDTLIAHIKGKPKKELKFHEKDIQNLKIRQFSKGRSDALTVAAYATAGVGVFLLLK